MSCTLIRVIIQHQSNFCMKRGGERTSSFHGHDTRELGFQPLGNRTTPALRGEEFHHRSRAPRAKMRSFPPDSPAARAIPLASRAISSSSFPARQSPSRARLVLLPHPALAARSSAMDPSRSSGRRGRGGKGGGGSRLGMKTAFSPTPPASPASSFSPPPPPTFPYVPPAPPSSSPAPAPPSSSPAPAPAASSSSPPQGVGVPPRPTQGVALGAMPPNFPYEQGNQQAPNLWYVLILMPVIS